MVKQLLLLVIFLGLGTLKIDAQSFPVPYDFDVYGRSPDSLYTANHSTHSSIKPLLPSDSGLTKGMIEGKLFQPNKHPNFILRKIFNEHLVQYYRNDYQFYFDFYPDFQVGRAGAKSTYLNTRGFQLGGKIGSQLHFQTSFFENQGKFPSYVDQYIAATRVIPGQGYARPFGKGGFDFASSDGYISYSPSKYFTFQVGHGKNFIGDGYRSLLLSDVSFNYPFIKIVTQVGPFRYLNLWSQMQYINESPFTDTTLYPKKYSVYQYLDWAVNNHLNIGVFQNTMIRPRGFDLNFINPLIFIRPTEYNIGNPDKSTIGFNGSYKLRNQYVIYGQLVINEFTVSKVFGSPGFYSNKQGYQLGGKAFNIAKIDRLNGLVEFNSIRPFTYTALSSIIAYGHYGQPLGDLLGNNFKEFILITNYTYERFYFRTQFLYALRGLDDPQKPFETTGGDLFKPYTYRQSDGKFFAGSGIRTNLYYFDLRASYMLNYKNNLRLEVSLTNRSQKNSLSNDNTSFFSIGLRGSFRNLYYDF